MKTGLLAIFIAFLFQPDHDYFVSVCEAEYVESKQRIEVALKVFSDDFDKVLKDRDGEDYSIGTEIEVANGDKLVFGYVKSKLRFEVDGKPVEWKYLGKEAESNGSEALWVFIYADEIEPFSELKVNNEIFLEGFQGQENIMNMKWGGDVQARRFNNRDAERWFRY